MMPTVFILELFFMGETIFLLHWEFKGEMSECFYSGSFLIGLLQQCKYEQKSYSSFSSDNQLLSQIFF